MVNRFLTRMPILFNQEKRVSSINNAGQLNTHIQKNKVSFLPHTIYKNYLKIHQKPTYKAETIKLLEKNIAGNLHDLWFGKGVLGHQKHEQKKKIDKLKFTKIKNFLHQRTLSEWKGNPIEWAKIHICKSYTWWASSIPNI